MKRRVVITSYSVINDMGKNRKEVEENIFAGKSGISMHDFEYGDGVTSGPFGYIQNLDEVHPFFAENGLPYDRCSQLALMAADDCFKESGLDVSKEDPYRCGVSIGTSLGGMLSGDEFHKQWIKDGVEAADASLLKQYPIHAVADVVAREMNFKGCKNIISTACSASGNSLGFAYDLIVNGSHDVIIAGGVDPASRFSFAGFTSLKAIDSQPCRPYSASTGINLAEGAAFLMMEEYEHAKARGANIIAEFLGYGISADAYHQTAPEPSGGGAMRAMGAALKSAGAEKSEISYVNGHGTGTHANDSAEPSALMGFFGDLAENVPMSSTKGATGHCLGAAGSVEAAISIMAIQRGELPPTIRFEEGKDTGKINFVPNVSQKHDVNVVMSNSFAFGGNNCCVVLAKPECGKVREEEAADRVVITGLGAVGAGGMNVKELFERFDNRDRRLVDVTEFDTSAYKGSKRIQMDEPNWKTMVPLKFLRRTDEIIKLTMASGKQALDSAKLAITRNNMDRVGLIYGTGAGPMGTIEQINRNCIEIGIKSVDPSSFPNSVLNQAPGNFSIANMLKGPTSTIAVSTTSQAIAFMYACELLLSDQAEAIVVSGADEWNEALFMGHGKMGLLSESGNPMFSKDSDGLILSEGSTAFVLEKESAAKARGANILATVLGYSIASDNCELNTVDASGDAMKHCVADAIAKSGVGKVGLYVASSCGTPAMDKAEANVINALFDADTKVSSAQAIVGTPIGAAAGYGILDALYAFETGKVVGMPEGDYEIAPEMQKWLNKGENVSADINTACVSAMGFGGSYVSIVLGKGEYDA